jgi:hypothetical protein
MKITVTQEHIDKGVRVNGYSCPITLALRDAGFVRPCVGIHRCYVSKKRFWFGYSRYDGTLPSNAVEFVRNFDVCNPVEPFTFEIEMTKC